jgi:hypothetical protein
MAKPRVKTVNVAKGKEKKHVDRILNMFEKKPIESFEKITSTRDPNSSINIKYSPNVAYFNLTPKNVIRVQRRLKNLIYTRDGEFVELGTGRIPEKVRDLAKKDKIEFVIKPTIDSFRRFDVMTEEGHYEIKTVSPTHSEYGSGVSAVESYLRHKGVPFLGETVGMVTLEKAGKLKLYDGKMKASSRRGFINATVRKIREPNLRLSHLTKETLFELAKKRNQTPKQYTEWLLGEVGGLFAKAHNPEKNVFFVMHNSLLGESAFESNAHNVRISLKDGAPYLAEDFTSVRFFSTQPNKSIILGREFLGHAMENPDGTSGVKSVRVEEKKNIKKMLRRDLDKFCFGFSTIHSLRNAIASSGLVPDTEKTSKFYGFSSSKTRQEVEKPLSKTGLFEPDLIEELKAKP